MSISKTKYKIPPFLYRGDDDKTGIRKLKSTIHHHQFQTNLINGGEGRTIFEVPLTNLITSHVGVGWEKTHFLSFSEEIQVAYRYGSRNPLLRTEEFNARYSDYLEDNDKWDFALLTLHTDSIQWTNLENGVFEGKFDPALTLFKKTGVPYRVILMDVKTILTKWKDFDTSYSKAFSNASRDKEWLLLPATKISLNGKTDEYSAILDGAPIRYRKFVLD